jgi:hypothetical protein
MKKFLRIISICSLCFTAFMPVEAQQQVHSSIIVDPGALAKIQGFSMTKTPTGDFVIAGQDQNQAIAMKIDTSEYPVLWSKVFGSTTYSFNCVAITHDSCYLFAGNTDTSASTGTDIFLAKLNQFGDTIWTRTIDMGYNENVYSIKRTSDNGFILVGDASQQNIVVIKIDVNGNLSWGKLITTGTLYQTALGVDQLSDGDYIIIGRTTGNNLLLMKLNTTGSIVWAKTKTSSSGIDVKAIQNGIILCYIDNSGTIIAKSDLNGNILWGNFYELNDIYSNSPRLHQTSDHGFDLTYGNNGLLKVDSIGIYQWAQRFLLTKINDVGEPGNGGYMVMGTGPIIGMSIQSLIDGEIGLIKADSIGNSECFWGGDSITSGTYSGIFSPVTPISHDAGAQVHNIYTVTNVSLIDGPGCIRVFGGVTEKGMQNPTFTMFPNPTNGVFTVKINEPSNEIQRIEVFNETGERVFQKSTQGSDSFTADISRLPDGVYHVIGTFRDSSYSQELVICH